MMNYYEFVSDEYASLFAEHHFQGFFLNRIPLLRRLHWREVVGCNILFGKSDKNKAVMDFRRPLDLSEPYYEAGVGIEKYFQAFRVDAIWRFSYLDHPHVSPFGIRGLCSFLLDIQYQIPDSGTMRSGILDAASGPYSINSNTGVPVHELGKVILRNAEIVGAMSMMSTCLEILPRPIFHPYHISGMRES
jgi:hypothetical protein